MNILFLTTQLPYPPYSGGVLKSWNLLKHWSAKNRLTLCTLLKDDDSRSESKLKKELSLAGYFSVELNIPRSPYSLLMSYFKSKSLNMYRNRSNRFKSKIREISQDQDLIIIDHYEMGQYLPSEFKGKVVLHTHNAEFMMWKRFAALESNWLKRWVTKRESRRIKKAELELINRSDLVLAAPNDIECFCSEGADRSKFAITYHLGDDHLLKLKNTNFDETEKTILYVGTLTWEANVDGLMWFIDEIWPKVHKNDDEIKLKIIGKNPDNRLVEASVLNDNISLLGFIEDLEPFFQDSRIFIAPLRFGSGIKVKVLNAMYRGIPIITTDIGIEGLKVENEKHLLYSNDPDKWVDDINKLMTQKNLWTNINQNSRDLVKEKYTWIDLLKNHDKQIEELFDKN